jgi:ABC-type Fe3+-hydroxamate transport system substrate-binding protein
MLRSWVKRVAGGIVLAALIVFLGACGTTTSLSGPSASAPASVSGRVVSQTTGAGLVDVPVRVASTIVHTDRLGKFVVTSLAAGTYSIKVAAPGYEDYTGTVRVAAGENVLGDIALLDLPPAPPVL